MRKKEIIFLHWYHHTTVLLFTWYTVMVMYPIGSVFGIVNSFVHTVMYSYYFLACFGHKPWWGKYVTRIQLTQMVIGMIATGIWAYYYYLSGQECPLWSPHLEDYELIKGYSIENTVIAASLLVYASYFVLFLHLYLNRFRETGETPTEVKRENTNKKKRE